MNRPDIGSKVYLNPSDTTAAEVTAHTARGFTYKGAPPLSIPRLGIHGDGTGERYCDIQSPTYSAWSYEPMPMMVTQGDPWADFPPGGFHCSSDLRKLFNTMNKPTKVRVVKSHLDATQHIQVSCDGVQWSDAEKYSNHVGSADVISYAKTLHQHLNSQVDLQEFDLVWTSE